VAASPVSTCEWKRVPDRLTASCRVKPTTPIWQLGLMYSCHSSPQPPWPIQIATLRLSTHSMNNRLIQASRHGLFLSLLLAIAIGKSGSQDVVGPTQVVYRRYTTDAEKKRLTSMVPAGMTWMFPTRAKRFYRDDSEKRERYIHTIDVRPDPGILGTFTCGPVPWFSVEPIWQFHLFDPRISQIHGNPRSRHRGS